MTWSAWFGVALTIGLVTAMGGGCSPKHDTFGPPPNPEGSVGAGIVPGGAGAVTVGSGGAGGSTQGTGGAPASAPPDCVCVLSAVSNPTCTTCVSMAGATSSTCGTQLSTCQMDTGCASIISCIKGQGCTVGSCVSACIALASGSADFWAAYEDCVCDNACAAQCNPAGATCP